MAQLNDLLVMGQSTLLGPVTFAGAESVCNQLINALSTASGVPKDADYFISQYANGGTTQNTYYRRPCSTIWDYIKEKLKYIPDNDISEANITSGSIIIGTATNGIRLRFDANEIMSTGYTDVNGTSSGTLLTNGPSPLYINLNGSPITIGDAGYSATNHKGGCAVRINGTLVIGSAKNRAGTELGGGVTAQTFNAQSDARLKENFQQFVPIKSILDLPIYKFDFIKGSKNQIGCKAQDLQEICPEIVNENSDGYLSIQENKIVYLLIEEVKKLKNKIEKMEGNYYG